MRVYGDMSQGTGHRASGTGQKHRQGIFSPAKGECPKGEGVVLVVKEFPIFALI